MQPKTVVIHHGHSFSETVYMVWPFTVCGHVSNSLEALVMIPTDGALGTISAHKSWKK
jgi:hypothetical protein